MTTITFHLPYFPAFGERISINWQTPSGEGLLAMSYEADDHVWKASLSLPRPPFSLEWHYIIRHPNGREEREGGPKRLLILEDNATSVKVQVFDFWRPPGDLLSVFTKAPFEETLFARRREASRPIKSSNVPQIVINIPAPAIDPEEGVYLVGEPESLGSWNPAYALPLRPGAYPYWELCLPTPLPNRFAYKYLIGKKEEGKLTWESGPNRIFASPPFTGVTLINDYPLYPPDGPGKWAGVIVPVFSLRSRRGLGVGEFLDLIPFITWARKAGLRIVQLLPINDTQSTGTWSDSYPYAIISTCALHPLYLNLDDLLPVRSPLRRQIRKEKARLHNIPHVDYPEVVQVKMKLLQEIFRLVAPSFLADRKAKAFIEENAAWLKPYAAFSFLRDKMGTGDFAKWGPYARGTPEIISRLNNPRSKHFSHVAFYYFLQYHLYRQLTHVTCHARAQGIVLKGDLPIGLSPASVEIWTHPEWFDRRYTMGAPPDSFSDTGQNWGFPLYDWEEMEKDGFAFWKMRFSHLARFFQCVRLDHVLGYFRIWAIPKENMTAWQGRFIPALPYLREELAAMGLDQIEDLLIPSIDEAILPQLFHQRSRKMLAPYIEKVGDGTYRFRTRYQSQKRLFNALKRKKREVLLEGVLKLQDEVLLIPEERAGKTYFQPRLRLEDTFRFASLTPERQSQLRHLLQDYFYRRNNELWEETGKKRLGALQAFSNCLLCAEDLGMVPDIVPPALAHLGLLSLRIERMPTRLGEIFALLSHYPYLSVASPGTHDMPPLRQWWTEEDRAVIQYYYEHCLGEKGIAPRVLPDHLIERIITRHLQAPSMFALFLIQDLLALDGRLRRQDPAAERINNPAIKDHHWDFRLHISVEDLLSEGEFTEKIRSLIKTAGRKI